MCDMYAPLIGCIIYEPGLGTWTVGIHWPAMTTHNKRVDIWTHKRTCLCGVGLFNHNVKRANLCWMPGFGFGRKTIVSLGCIKYLRTQFSITKCFSSFCLLADGQRMDAYTQDMLEYSRAHWLSSQLSSLSYVRGMQKPLIKCHTDCP